MQYARIQLRCVSVVRPLSCGLVWRSPTRILLKICVFIRVATENGRRTKKAVMSFLGIEEEYGIFDRLHAIFIFV